MTESTYTITISEAERTAFAKVLGGLVTKLINRTQERQHQRGSA